MKKQFFALFILLLVPLVAAYSGGSTLYPWPTDFSFSGLASWSQPLVASGTALPADANAHPGDIFILTATPTAPTLWRRGASTWVQMSGAATSGGVSTHSLLLGLAFADSGHTGFNSAASHTLHIEDQTDPHGASMTVTEKVTIGSGTPDIDIYRVATGVVGLATDVYVVGKVGIGTSTPDCSMQNQGFSRLGELSPKIKTVRIIGTTASTEGGETSVAHGIASSTKIISASALVEFATGAFSSVEYQDYAGYQFSFAITSTDFILYNNPTNSENILSKPFTAIIFYTE